MTSPQKKLSKSFTIHQDVEAATNPQVCLSGNAMTRTAVADAKTLQPSVKRTASALPLPLTTSRLANQLTRESPKVSSARQSLPDRH